MKVPYNSSIVDDDLGAHTIYVDMTTVEQVGILRGWHLDCMDRSINRSYSVWNSIPIAQKLFPLFIRWPSYALLKIRPMSVIKYSSLLTDCLLISKSTLISTMSGHFLIQ